MERNTKEIVSDIRALLNELDGSASPSHKLTAVHTEPKKQMVGCIGAIQDLIEQGFLNQAVDVAQVVEKLKEEGQPYSRALVSMNLLNLVKPPRKFLRRIDDAGRWKYIVRT